MCYVSVCVCVHCWEPCWHLNTADKAEDEWREQKKLNRFCLYDGLLEPWGGYRDKLGRTIMQWLARDQQWNGPISYNNTTIRAWVHFCSSFLPQPPTVKVISLLLLAYIKITWITTLSNSLSLAPQYVSASVLSCCCLRYKCSTCTMASLTLNSMRQIKALWAPTLMKIKEIPALFTVCGLIPKLTIQETHYNRAHPQWKWQNHGRHINWGLQQTHVAIYKEDQ